MKYFTIQGWSGEVEDPSVAIEAYRCYLDGIRSDLPDSIRQLAKEVCLHDSRPLRVHGSPPERSLVLELEGGEYHGQARKWFGRRFRFSDGEVASVTSTADRETGLPGPHGYGDLGCDEIECIGAGICEYRMLFSSGIELQVRFSEFSF